MNLEYTIREAIDADLETLVDFAIQEARETEGTDPDASAVRIGVGSGLEGSVDAKYWVALSGDGQTVGAISVVTEWSNFRGGYYWWVQSLFVVPDHRGTGLVDFLLNTIADLANAAGALDLRLYVLQSNHRAIAAYRRCSFKQIPYVQMSRSLTR